MKSPETERIEPKQCPKCKGGFYMLVFFTPDKKLSYVCPICNHTIFPDK